MGASWSVLILWAAVADAVLQAIVGVAHVDREAIAFAVLFAAGVVVLLRASQGSRVGSGTVLILGLLFADVAFWMITATWSNVRNHEQLLYIIEPLALACASAAGLIGVVGQLVDRHGRVNGAAAVVTAAAFGLHPRHGWRRDHRLGQGADAGAERSGVAHPQHCLSHDSDQRHVPPGHAVRDE